MALQSDLYFDQTRCVACGILLHRNFAGKRPREVLREFEEELFIATMVEVTCSACGGSTEIFYQGEAIGLQERVSSNIRVDTMPCSVWRERTQDGVKEGCRQATEKGDLTMNEISDLTENFSMRITKDEKEGLRRHAKNLGLTQSEVFRE